MSDHDHDHQDHRSDTSSYYHDPLFSFFGPADHHHSAITDSNDESNHQTPSSFHDVRYMGLLQADQFFNGSNDYDYSYSSSSSQPPPFATSLFQDDQKLVMDTGNCLLGVADSTNSSSVRSSSTEPVDDDVLDVKDVKKENQLKDVVDDQGDHGSKKTIKQKKEENKKREPRFAFVTKTDVDHLEDGYRWRKYGQKAVKNSPYPRSYYRCTTQKCTVKKRVERSYQDPATVITTYEGQHNHHLPATLRGNIGGTMLYQPSMMAAHGGMMTAAGGSSFPHDFLAHGFYNSGGGGGGSMYRQTNLTPIQQLQIPDYGLLQDMVPSMSFKQEP